MSFARLSRVVFSVGVLTLLGLLPVPAHATTIVDHGNYTTFVDLNVDVYDLSAFYNLTQVEAQQAIAAIPGGWHLGTTSEVYALYNALTAEQYAAGVKDMLGCSPQGPGTFVSVGRTSDYDTGNNWYGVHGFGDGVQLGSGYVWGFGGLFQAGVESARYPDYGAWAIRAVPEPSTCASLLAGLAFGCYTIFRRRSAR
jgi:hypothetical protein